MAAGRRKRAPRSPSAASAAAAATQDAGAFACDCADESLPDRSYPSCRQGLRRAKEAGGQGSLPLRNRIRVRMQRRVHISYTAFIPSLVGRRFGFAVSDKSGNTASRKPRTTDVGYIADVSSALGPTSRDRGSNETGNTA